MSGSLKVQSPSFSSGVPVQIPDPARSDLDRPAPAEVVVVGPKLAGPEFSVVREGTYFYGKDRRTVNGRRLNRVLERYGSVKPEFFPASARLEDAHVALASELEQSVDLILTDPPFGVTSAPWDVQPDWAALAPGLQRVLKRSGNLVVFGNANSLFNARAGLDSEFDFVREIVWVKSTEKGTLRPGPLSPKFHPAHCHESIWFFGPKGVPASARKYRPYSIRRPTEKWASPQKVPVSRLPNQWGGGIAPAKERKRIAKRPYLNPVDVVCYPPETGGASLFCAKPLPLLRDLILMSTDPGDLVLDPFAGTGTTLLTAMRVCRRAIGYEKDPVNFEELRRRLHGNNKT
ncbi:MAG TPA: site-specific DNA-methyltransferase [Thermoplasmata archaeon]|nr:site-specific DNA-methyltransferase [Thermoplasmata archaeon]